MAQEYYRATATSGTLVITGTSNQGEWTVTATEVKAEMRAGTPCPMSLEVIVPVVALTGGIPLMDQRLTEMFSPDKFPDITFDLEACLQVEGGLELSGYLSMAGVTREVRFLVKRFREKQGIRLKGEVRLRFADFRMKPPRAMNGSILADEEITVRFDQLYLPV